MTKRAGFSVRSLASVVALCVVALQLVTVLHFSLVPHGLGGGASGLVHLHRALSTPPEQSLRANATEDAPHRPTLVLGSASSTPDACPLGFSGPPMPPVAESPLCSLICLPVLTQHVAREHVASDRSRALLSAPKTSPPRAA